MSDSDHCFLSAECFRFFWLKAQAPSNKIIGKPKYLLRLSSLDSFKPFRTCNLRQGWGKTNRASWGVSCKDLSCCLLFFEYNLSELSGKYKECTLVILWFAVRVCLLIGVCVCVFLCVPSCFNFTLSLSLSLKNISYRYLHRIKIVCKVLLRYKWSAIGTVRVRAIWIILRFTNLKTWVVLKSNVVAVDYYIDLYHVKNAGCMSNRHGSDLIWYMNKLNPLQAQQCFFLQLLRSLQFNRPLKNVTLKKSKLPSTNHHHQCVFSMCGLLQIFCHTCASHILRVERQGCQLRHHGFL